MGFNYWIETLLGGLLIGGLYVCTSMGLSLAFGVQRMFNVNYGELLVLGAYLTWMLNTWTKLDPMLLLIVTIPILFMVGYVLQRWIYNPLMRAGSMMSAVLASFGMSTLLSNGYKFIWTTQQRSVSTAYTQNAVVLGNVHLSLMYIIATVIGIAMTVGLGIFVKRTKLGNAMRATAQDYEAAEAMGINVPRIWVIASGLGAGLAAVGGALIVMTLSVSPNAGMTFVLKAFILIVLGSMGSIPGTFFGGLILGLWESLGAAVLGVGYKDLVGLVLFLIVLAVKPSGLFRRAH